MQSLTARSLEEYQNERMKFSSSLTFMLSALGFSAGFGSVWRFPYLVFKNGGGTFLIPYFILLFTLAIPLFYLEISLGQIKGIGLPHILELEKPRLKGFGYVGIIIVIYISSYYNLIMAYAFDFFWNSFETNLPWSNDSELNSKSYFYNEMIHMSTGIDDINYIVWPIFFSYAISLCLVYICIKEGVQTSGKIAIVTATTPYLILVILLVRGVQLQGGMSGIYYLFEPNLIKIFDPLVWVDAANQVIFQISVGLGVIILYGSYREKQEDITTFSILIPLLTAFCGLLAACVIFTYIGYVSHQTNISIDQLPLSGPDLAFVLYPAILSGMPYPNVWCLLFFGCLVLLGIDTQFGFIEGLAGTIEDIYYGEVRIFGYLFSIQNTRLMICVLNGIVGILYCTDAGFYLLNFVDTFGTNVGFMLMVLFEIGYFCWGERFKELENDIVATNNYMPKFIKFSLEKICHYSVIILLFFSLISQIKESFSYSISISIIGWIISLFPFIIALYMYYKNKNVLPKVTNSLELQLFNQEQQEQQE